MKFKRIILQHLNVHKYAWASDRKTHNQDDDVLIDK